MFTHTSIHPYLHPYIHTSIHTYKVVSKRSEIYKIGLYTRKYTLDSSLGTIPFKIVPLCSNTVFPVLLPLLEHVLQACQAPSEISIGSPPWCQNGDPSSSGRGRSRRGSNLASRTGAIGLSCWYNQETHFTRAW